MQFARKENKKKKIITNKRRKTTKIFRFLALVSKTVVHLILYMHYKFLNKIYNHNLIQVNIMIKKGIKYISKKR